MDLETMRARNWRQLIRPRGVSVITDSETYGKFVAEPLEQGYGHTLGPSIQETLRTSIRGSAVIAYRSEGECVEGEELPLNLKQIVLWSSADIPQTVSGEFSEGPVLVSDFSWPEDIYLRNPSLQLATVPEGGKLSLELVVSSGFSYVLAQDIQDCPEGFSPLDAAFSPIEKVKYTVSPARVGQQTDYHKLSLQIYSNGVISPREALLYSTQLLKTQMAALINFEESDEALPEEESSELRPIFNENLNRRVADLELSVRSSNCLKNADIEYIGDLVQRTESDMLKTKNFGRKSLQEIQSVLEGMGLELGMDIEGWQPQPFKD